MSQSQSIGDGKDPVNQNLIRVLDSHIKLYQALNEQKKIDNKKSDIAIRHKVEEQLFDTRKAMMEQFAIWYEAAQAHGGAPLA